MSSCLIHCTNGNSQQLVECRDLESWVTLVNAAKIRDHEAVLKIARCQPEGTFPKNITYHRDCRAKFTMKRTLESISGASSSNDQSVRRSSREGMEKGRVFAKVCLFCQKKKYAKKSRTLEKLRCCNQLRVNVSIRDAAKAKNDTQVLATVINDLAILHASEIILE